METTTLQNDYGSWIWPAYDQCCWQVIFNELPKLEEVIALTADRRTAIQAGGNCGVFAKTLAKYFRKVLTFEPNALNYSCLIINCTEPNIWAFQSALGDARTFVGMKYNEPDQSNNSGALTAFGDGDIPMIAIDDLALENCGLIYLDIEGWEEKAIHGAIKTIHHYKPVIAFEDKGLGNSPLSFLEDMGYKWHSKIQNDVVVLPC